MLNSLRTSTRFAFSMFCVLASFLTIVGSMLGSTPPEITQQLIQSLGLFLTVVAGGFLGSKAVEHGVKHLDKTTT